MNSEPKNQPGSGDAGNSSTGELGRSGYVTWSKTTSKERRDKLLSDNLPEIPFILYEPDVSTGTLFGRADL